MSHINYLSINLFVKNDHNILNLVMIVNLFCIKISSPKIIENKITTLMH